jgi:hypothetical protein
MVCASSARELLNHTLFAGLADANLESPTIRWFLYNLAIRVFIQKRKQIVEETASLYCED